LYSLILRDVAFPLIDFAVGTHTRNYLIELEKSQWFSPAAINGLQQRRIQHLIRHAYHTVPWYHEVFRKNNLKPDDIRTTEDLVKLPILTRSEFREQSNALISRDYPKERMVYGVSGGSTGEPIKFYTTKENRERNMATRYLAWKWAGFELGVKFAHVVGSPMDRPFFKSVRGKIEGKVKRRIYLDAFKMTAHALEKFAEEMNQFKPEVIYGYAKSVALLAKFIEDKGMGEMHLRSVIVDSEGLSENETKTIERVFGCKVWLIYHNRENGTFGADCTQHDGFHLFIQNHVFEFSRQGEHVVPGEVGSIVVTDLTNYAMPFVRYEIGDMGVFSDEFCPCGRSLPLMRKLVGRTSEVLVSATGRFMFGDLFHLYTRFYDLTRVKQYQIIQENPNKIVVNLIPEKDYSKKDTEVIRKGILSLMGDMDVEIRLVEKIPKSSSGKVQAVIRKFPIKFT
jgi:phenylacetate-CoA ligase